MDEYVNKEDATKFLGVTKLKFEELLRGGRLNPELSRTYPNPREPGKLLEEHPNNEECYSLNDLRKLKQALDAERRR
jgi:hypothetical protein